MSNCGLEALSKIRELNDISALSLIYLARDNGLNLKIFKVKESDLPLVHRPAIFHSDNHFEYIKNGESLPDLNWTGYVLTQKSIGMPVSHSEAKNIKGQKKGGFFKQIAAVVVATAGQVIGIPAPLTYAAAIGTQVGMDQYAKSKHPEQLGEPGTFGGIATSGLKGALAAYGGINFAKGGLAGVAQGQAAGAKGIASGLKGAFIGTSPSATTAGSSGIIGSGGKVLGIGAGSLAPTGSKGLAGGLTLSSNPYNLVNAGQTVSNAAFQGATSGASAGLAGGGFNAGVSGYGLANQRIVFDAAGKPQGGGGIFSRSNLGNVKLPIQVPAQIDDKGLFGLGGNATSGLKTAGLALGANAIASSFGPKQPGALQFDPTKEFTVLRDFLGDQALPQATEKELMTYVHTPLTGLADQLAPQRDKIMNRLNKSFDLRDAQIRKQYAQFGQNETNSTDAAKQLQLSQQDRATAIQEAEQEFQSDAIGKAIQAKQFALTSSIQNNQFDQQLAFELADSIGQKEALNVAIQSQNYQQFQNIMSQILNIGFGSRNNSGININLGGKA